MIFKVPGGFWGSENPKKSIKVGSERLRGAKNDAKRGLGRLIERKMSQHEAPRDAKRGTIVIDGRSSVVIFGVWAPPKDRRSL